jgi:single-stranded-DNA-specific exonuclease
LIEVSGAKTPLDSFSVAFKLAPRINAAGRFGNASDAVDMFLTEDIDEARRQASELDGLNRLRKDNEATLLRDIEDAVNRNPSVLFERVLVFRGFGWSHGVIGIAASRLVERFGKPVFIMTDDETPGYVKGSARGLEGFSIYKALSACSGILTKFGGHSGAGGFSLEDKSVPAFDRALQAYAAENFSEMPLYALHAEFVMPPEKVTVENVTAISLLEPFGEGNRRPLFAFGQVLGAQVFSLSSGRHTKLRLNYGGRELFGLLFGVETAAFPYKSGDYLDILAELSAEEYKGEHVISLKIADCKRSGVSSARYFAAKAAYERVKRGEGFERELRPRIVPERGDLAAVYRAAPRNKPAGCDTVFFSLDEKQISYCKFRLSLDIFEELGLAEIDRYNDAVKLTDGNKKVALENSKIVRELSGGCRV